MLKHVYLSDRLPPAPRQLKCIGLLLVQAAVTSIGPMYTVYVHDTTKLTWPYFNNNLC